MPTVLGWADLLGLVCIVPGSRSDPPVRLCYFSVLFLYIFPAWSYWDTVKAVLQSTTGCFCITGQWFMWHFFWRYWRRFLRVQSLRKDCWKRTEAERVELGTVTLTWPLERCPSDLLPKLDWGNASERISWWLSGKAKEWMEEQRSHTQAFSSVSFHLAICTYIFAQIANRLDFAFSVLHFQWAVVDYTCEDKISPIMFRNQDHKFIHYIIWSCHSLSCMNVLPKTVLED